jgi:cell division protein FtsI (penicillin-binding protein 3)
MGASRRRALRGSTHLRAAPFSRPGGSRSPARLIALFVTFVVMFGAMGTRLVMLQAVQFPKYARLAADQRRRELTFAAQRGTIFDRNGESLAVSVELQTVFTDPVHVEDPYWSARRLSRVLDLPARVIEEKLHGAYPGDRFEYLARQVAPSVAKAVGKLDLPGIYMRPEPKRIYPSDRLASHVLGFVNADGDALEGIELQYDDVLRGDAGRMTLEQDPSGRPLPQAEFVYERAEPGRSLYLTIDRDIQLVAQEALSDAVRRYGAEAASAIVVRPDSGEILALANLPDYDPNNFQDFDEAARRNRAVTDNYEPGSAFKIVTASAALEERVVTPHTRFSVPDELQVADRVIHDSHYHAVEEMSVEDIVVQSSNVGTVMLGLKLKPALIDKWIRRFGFGQKTGLDFPGEAAGIVLDLEDWWGSSIGTIPLGQGIAVTPLQMAQAYSTIANGGVWVEPKLMLATMEQNGDTTRSTEPARRRVLSKRTSRQMMRILRRVVSEGTGVMAQVPGYPVAGKTGTAQKPLPEGGYGKSYIASFAGIAPAGRPEIVVIVTLDEPRPIWGGATAAPTFEVIAEEALRHLGVPPAGNAERSAASIAAEQASEPTPRD